MRWRNKLYPFALSITMLWGTLLAASLSYAETQHDMQNMAGSNSVSVDGYILLYTFETPEEHKKMMTDMKMDPSKMKMDEQASHHFSIEIKDPSGKPVDDAVMKVKIVGPDQKDQMKDAVFSKEMNHYGCDFDMKQKGKYGVMLKFQTSDKKIHPVRFWHEMK